MSQVWCLIKQWMHLCGSHKSSVSWGTGLQAGWLVFSVLSGINDGNFSLCWGPPRCTRSSYTRGKVAGMWSWPFTSI